MEAVSISTTALSATSHLFPILSPRSLLQKPSLRKTSAVSAVKTTSSRAVRELVEDDVMQMFLKDRELNGDFIAKASNKLWFREFLKSTNADDTARGMEKVNSAEQVITVEDQDDGGGFLKLKQTQEWILGKYSSPMNKQAIAKAIQDDRERRKKLNLLEYEALKRELMLVSVGIGAACSGYCLIALSAQAAISYSVGALFSCLYLRLLYGYADNITKEMVPQIFMQKKSKKKIGIRSEDLNNFLERSVKGSGLALSSPRLVIPAAIYGLWALSHNYLENDLFDFQIVPAMFGMFVYKAAALVQVYRDNQDLQFIFPENQEGSTD